VSLQSIAYDSIYEHLAVGTREGKIKIFNFRKPAEDSADHQ